MTERELRDYLPYISVADGAVLSKRGDVTFGWELTLPTAFTVNEAGYDSIIFTFLSAYNSLPDWTVVHKQDIYCKDTYHAKKRDEFLADAEEKNLEGRKFLNGHCYLYVTFSDEKVIRRKNSESGFFGFSGLKKVGESFLEHCASSASKFEAILSSNDLLGVRAMTTDDFIRMDENGRDQGTIADFLRLYRDDGPDYNLYFERDHIEYGDEQLRCWYVEDSDAYQGLVSSVCQVQGMSAGNAKVFLSGGSPIGFHLRIPHIVNRYVVKLPSGTVERELDEKRRTMNSFANFSKRDDVNAAELDAFLKQAAVDSAKTTKCHMNVMAWCEPSKLVEVRNMIYTAFQVGLQVSVVEETRVTPLLHYAAIPGAEAELGYDNYLTSEIVSFLCQGLWDGYDRGIRGGVIQLLDRETMTPVKIDIQQVARKRGFINGMNAIVVGPTGSGKSFTMNKLVQDFYNAGQHIFIVDVGDSYQGIAQVINEESGGKDGIYNTYDPAHPFGFNPFKNFRHWNDTDSDGDKVNSGYDFFLSLLKTIYVPKDGWNKESSSTLKYLVSLFLDWWVGGVPDPETLTDDLLVIYKNERRKRLEKQKRKIDEDTLGVGFRNPVTEIFAPDRKEEPVFDDFYRFVSRMVAPLQGDDNFKVGDVQMKVEVFDAVRFATAMDMYKKDGMYGFLLNAEDENDLFASRLTIFEVDKIKDNDDVFPIWTLLIMHAFEDKMRSLRCQKVMIIEEAWTAIAKETMAEYITWMWRTARKFSTSAMVVTQHILDLTGSSIVKDAIVVNSEVRILLDQRTNPANFERGAEVMGLSQMQRNLVMSVGANLHTGYGKYKEVFFSIGPNYSNVFALQVSPRQQWTFESNKDDKAPVLQRAKDCGSTIRAICDKADGLY